MSQPVVTAKSFYRHFITSHEIPFLLLAATMIISALLILAFWAMSWPLWQVGLLILAVWTPLVLIQTRSVYRQQPWLALLFVLVITQGGHTIEHFSQMIEMHVLGMKGMMARGIIGVLDMEWVHLTWSSWFLVLCAILVYGFRHNKLLWMLLIFAIYHECEHIYIVSVYVRTHVMGTPGLLAHGGLIGGGLPIARPELHFLYAVLEEATLIMVYLSLFRKMYIAKVKAALFATVRQRDVFYA